MASNPIFESFLANQGFALFEYLGEGAFRAIGRCPAWLEKVWGAGVNRTKTIQLGEQSPFLENFLIDAEEFWNSKSEGAASSGNWIERGADGIETPLEALALWLDKKRVLLVRNFTSSYAQQQQWLQTARDSLLEHERLMREIQKKEILLHCIVHDLSQPLTAMRGCFNCLTIGDLPSDLRPFVETGQRESQRQEQMIRGILEAFSADLAGQKSQAENAAEAPDLAACAKHAVQNLSAAFTEKGVRLQVDPLLDVERRWKSAGDASRIDRIFGNLLENALRYSPRGSTVTVGVEEKGNFLLAYVDDEGPGLPKDQSTDKLFALFAKGKDRPGKAGLGLYFCKMTVERWGGRIGAESRVKAGTRFWFRLPRAAKAAQGRSEEQKSAAAKLQEERVEKSAVPSGGRGLANAARPLRILVADDTEVNRELAMELLKKRGHTVAGVEDGSAALAALEKQRYDVVLMDDVMPGMSGLDATRAIRQKEASSGNHQLIIGLTGNATKEDEKRLLDGGMDAFISKPFDMFKLFQTVESAGSQATPMMPPPATAALPSAPSESVAVHLDRTTGGNQKLIRSLVKSFLADAPKRISDMERAIAQKDAGKLGSAAHALKGAVAIFGAPKTVAAARNLEAMGRAGNLQSAKAEFQTLAAEFVRLKQELLALGSEKKSASKSSAPPPRPASRSRRNR